MKPRLSIIIPCYNAEGYLRHCLESVAAQRHQDWECLCIDDGSHDQTAELIRSFASADARFCLIAQENQGAAAARNHALRLAQGDFIAFLDSDDYLHPRALELMLDAMQDEGLDCVVCGTRFVGEQTHDYEEITTPLELERVQPALRLLLKKATPDFSCWGKLYRRELLEGVLFKDTFPFEDGPWLLEVLGRSRALGLLGVDLIFCYVRAGSGTRSSWTEAKTRDILASVQDFLAIQPARASREFEEMRQHCVAFCLRRLLYELKCASRWRLYRDAAARLRTAHFSKEGLAWRHRVVLVLLRLLSYI